jgi:hypothetical protein
MDGLRFLFRVFITFLVYIAHGTFGLTFLQDIWLKTLTRILA